MPLVHTDCHVYILHGPSPEGEGRFLQETVSLETREEVFSGQAAPEVALPGRSAAVCCHPLHPGWETWCLEMGSNWVPLGFWQGKETEVAYSG